MTGHHPGSFREHPVTSVDGHRALPDLAPPDADPRQPARPDRPLPGRHTPAALGGHAVAVETLATAPAADGTPFPWLANGRHRRAVGRRTSAQDGAPRGATFGGAAVRIRRAEYSPNVAAQGYDGIEVYAAASLARRSAKDTVSRLAQCKDRVCIASRTASCSTTRPEDLSTGAAAIAGAAAYRIRAVQQADRMLADALDNLDAAKVAVGEVERALRRYHPYGGTLVVTLATRRLALDRVGRATTTATTLHHLADSATYRLVKEIVAGERAVRAVDNLVDYLLDHSPAAAAPPPLLRLVRAALPRTQQLDWWRELCSLFAECEPDERRTQATSQFLNAPRTVWTSWSSARHVEPAPRTDDDQT
jgi:hypothetical protein